MSTHFKHTYAQEYFDQTIEVDPAPFLVHTVKAYF